MNQAKKFNKDLSEQKNKYIVLLVGITSAFVFLTMENCVWLYGYLIGKLLQTNGYVFEPWMFEKNIPVVSQFFFIYIFAIPFWIFSFTGIYYLKGPKACYKSLGISAIVFFITGIIYTAAPTYAGNLAAYGWKQIANKNGFIYDKIRIMWNTGIYLSACPSQHCSCSILITFAFLFNKNEKQVNKNQIISRYLVSSFISIYSFLVCLSTFLLKQHFFIDWLVSLSLCSLCWIICTYYPKINIFYKIYAWLFSNFFAFCGLNERGVESIVTPVVKNKIFENIDKYSKKKRIWINIGYNALVYLMWVIMVGSWLLTVIFCRGIKPEPWPPV